MVRFVEETIEVRVGDPYPSGSACGDDVGEGRRAGCSPEQFLWRGRIYRVTGVLAHWQERHAWWRAAADRPLSQVPLSRDVWRVEASPGRSSAPGVYDLGNDGGSEPGSGWLLLRTQD